MSGREPAAQLATLRQGIDEDDGQASAPTRSAIVRFTSSARTLAIL
jgi:hypothetical protein